MLKRIFSKRNLPLWGAALLSGAIMYMAYPPAPAGGRTGAFFALVPLLAAVRSGISPRKSAFFFFAAGMFFWPATLSWFPAIVPNGGPWPLVALGWFGLSAVCSLFFALFGWLDALLWKAAGDAPSWRRLPAGHQCLILTCHRDILEWVQPDWIFDTATGKFSSTEGVQRPRFELEIYQTDWRYWPAFEKHHYLKLPQMVAAKCYVGTVDGEPVCHLAVSSRNKGRGVEARACRLVVLPEWQGAGVGMRFLNAVCEIQLRGEEGARLTGRPATTLFHTSHPGLAAALRCDRKWRQVSAALYGECRSKCIRTMRESNRRKLEVNPNAIAINGAGYGGHFRAVQGFRYVGEEGLRNE